MEITDWLVLPHKFFAFLKNQYGWCRDSAKGKQTETLVCEKAFKVLLYYFVYVQTKKLRSLIQINEFVYFG